jgi:CarboxypepD_reg-like domain
MSCLKTYQFLFLLLFATTLCYSQKIIKGMVVDSASLNSLQGVNVKVKNSNRGTSTNANGVFTLVATETDTLIFSFVGYAKAELPIYIEDETMFVRLREESFVLKEVIIKDQGFHINQKYPTSPTLSTTKPLKAGSSGGVGINFSYFSKLEKEKRKLVKVMAENEKVKIYLGIVNDPDLKFDIIERHAITEEKFYDLLALYNETHKDIMYSSNSGLILNSLLSYYENATRKK